MSKLRKHIDRATSPEEFKGYLEGKLSARDQHAFEKRMMEDGFEAEALEGFEKYDAEVVAEDLAELNAELAKKTQPTRTPYFRVAAVVALFISATVALFFLIKPAGMEELADSPAAPEKELADTKPRTEPDDRNTPHGAGQPTESDEATASSDRQRSRPDIFTEREAPKETLAYHEADFDEVQEIEEMVERETLKIVEEKYLENIAPSAEQVTELKPIPEVSDLKRAASLEVPPSENPVLKEGRGELPSRFTYPEAKKDAPVRQDEEGFSMTMAGRTYSKKSASKLKAAQSEPEEVVSVPAPVSSGAAKDFAAVPPANNEAQPINGYEAYYRYLYESTRQLNTAAEKLPQTVELQIRVSEMGRVAEVKSVTEIGGDAGEKLKAIILDGPGWIPAHEDGNPIEKWVDLKLEFDE